MSEEQEREFEEGGAGTKADRKKDPLKEYDEKEAMSPAKIKEHEPTAVKRDPSDQKIVEPGQQGGTSSDEARQKARRSGMTKGTAVMAIPMIKSSFGFVIVPYYLYLSLIMLVI